MRIALVDDQPEERNRLSQMIQKHLSAAGTNIRHIDTYRSAEDFLSVWKAGMYDLIFMDIYFDKTALSGIDAARKIRETDQAVLLVFCTTSNEFASESYEVHAHNYLLKPLLEENLSPMLQQLIQNIHEPGYMITLPDGQNLFLRNIIFTEYFNHVVTFHNKKGEDSQLRITHGELEHLLCQYSFFCHCSKGIIVNLYEVSGYNKETFLMSDGKRIPISRRKAKDVQDTYNKFRLEQLRKEICE